MKEKNKQMKIEKDDVVLTSYDLGDWWDDQQYYLIKNQKKK